MTPRRIHRSLIVAVIASSVVVVSQARPAHATTDLHWARQWAPSQIGAPDAWRRTTGAGVRIGIVDTGVDLAHEDLAVKIVASTSCIGVGGSAASCRGNGQDDNGHGTAVSSVAAAVTDNGKGIAGIAPGAELVVARSLTDDGRGGASGVPEDVLAGIDWVVGHGARIVNLSLGADADEGPGPSLMAQAIERAWARGAVPVVAAGNGTPDGARSVYADLNAVVVGASRRDGSAAPYSVSLRGAKWGLLAPGGVGGDPTNPSFVSQNVVSANWVNGRKNSYGAGSGTSIATPHVSGALALLLAQGLTRQDAIRRMLESADDSRPCGEGCHGRLDIGRAVGSARPPDTPSTVVPDGRQSTTDDETRAGGGAGTPSEAAANDPPEDSGAGGPVPRSEPIPIDVPDQETPGQSLALLPEPGSSLRLTAAAESDALVPRSVLFLVVSMTVVSSVALEWLARRDGRRMLRSAGGPDGDAGGGAFHQR